MKVTVLHPHHRHLSAPDLATPQRRRRRRPTASISHPRDTEGQKSARPTVEGLEHTTAYPCLAPRTRHCSDATPRQTVLHFGFTFVPVSVATARRRYRTRAN
ncbi:unnamed protein product [Acanthoscelides obtectus]|uniref:Uncharacterized protein n=1 Tax=Acanthoscelides obtectus TaxID=200917 RepID=A0A9P0NX17_ACAOB|nr:unnamed protein product [Acanthoscelides obtectus]CAK1621164.1 hypothetical protein AOBTE_LOCUS801 [Acanthoscelides obtectus]